MSKTAYQAFRGERADSINSTDENISTLDAAEDMITPILTDVSFTRTQRYQFAQIFELLAKNLKQTPSHTYVSVENENYSLPQNRGISGHLAKRNIPRRVSENVFTITFIWQLVFILGLEAVDAITKHEITKERPYYISGVAVLVLFEIANLILCLSVTVKLFKQYKHRNTSMKFLFHAYISTLFLFGGMYTFTAWVFPDSFTNLSHKTSKFRTLYLYSQLIFTSISTGTLCGASHVTAAHVTTEFMMSFQMLISFLYFASILSEVLNPSTAVGGRVKETLRKVKSKIGEHTSGSGVGKKKKSRKLMNI